VSLGGGAGHAFVLNTGFGFHKPYERSAKPKVPTRDHGFEYGLEFSGGRTFGPNLLFGYKWNPHLSVALGYGFGYLSTGKVKAIEESGRSNLEHEFKWEAIAQNFFLRGLYRVTDAKFSPFASVDLGMRFYSEWDWRDGSFPSATDRFEFERDPEKPRSSGILIAPAIGGSLRTTNNSYFEFKIGYARTNALRENVGQRHISNRYNSYNETITFHRKGLSGLFVSLGYRHTLKLGAGVKDKVKKQYERSKDKIKGL